MRLQKPKIAPQCQRLARQAPALAVDPAGTRQVGCELQSRQGPGVAGRLFGGIDPRSDEFAVSPPAPGWQSDASIAALADGRFVVTHTDTHPGGDVCAPDRRRRQDRRRVVNDATWG